MLFIIYHSLKAVNILTHIMFMYAVKFEFNTVCHTPPPPQFYIALHCPSYLYTIWNNTYVSYTIDIM